MALSLLKQKLSEIKEPTQEFWCCFEKKLFLSHYSAKDVWLQQGTIGEKIGFIATGGAISYQKTEDQKKVNKLWLEREFILSASVFTLSPSEHTIEFRQDSHILQFSLDAISQLRKRYDDAILYLDYFFGLEIRAFDRHTDWLKSSVGEKRYQDSIEKYGPLYTNLIDDEKATFIGVSERWISDLKKEKGKNRGTRF